MEILENVEIAGDKNVTDFRFPVQYVNRPNLDFRGFCGTVASGVVKVGDELQVLPSMKTSKVKSMVTYDGNLEQAFVGQATTITLEDEIDISRGDMLVHKGASVGFSNRLRGHLVWMSEQPLQKGKQYLFKFASKLAPGVIDHIDHRIDVNTFEHSPIEHMELNDIAMVDLELEKHIAVDPYALNRATGAFIIIDRLTNITVGAGMIEAALEAKELTETHYSAFELELNALIRKHFPHWEAKDLSLLK